MTNPTPVTYSYLVTEVPKVLLAKNRDLPEDMPNVIRRAVEMIFGVLDHDAYRVTLANKTVDSGSNTIDLSNESPLVFETRSLGLIRTGFSLPVPLLRRDIDYLQAVYSDQIPGEPVYYAETPGYLQYSVFPAPDVEYQIVPQVNQHPQALGDGSGGTSETNVLTKEYPRVIETASLYHGAKFMKDQTQIDRWKSEFDQAVVEANAQIQRRKRDNTGQRPVQTDNSGV